MICYLKGPEAMCVHFYTFVQMVEVKQRPFNTNPAHVRLFYVPVERKRCDCMYKKV